MATGATGVFRRALAAAAHAGANELSDRELLRRFADDGDQAAFALLVARHTGMVFGVCRRATSTVQDAEDACQATFLVLARKARCGGWQPSVANWLYSAARKTAGNARVAAARRAKREARAAVPDRVEPLDTMTGRELLAALDEELDRLTALYREPLVLCYLEGLTREVAAARLGVPAATVKTRLERGRKKLGAALARRGVVAGGVLALAATSPAGASPPRLVEAALSAAAGHAPPAVLALAEGVAVNKSLWAVAALVGVATLGIGVGLGRQAPASPQPGKMMPAKQAAAAEAKAPADRPAVVAGRVLDPDGKPAAGVKLYVPKLRVPEPVSPQDVTAEAIGTTGPDGSFRVALPPQPKPVRDYLIAHAPGFGVDWVIASELPPGDVTLKLVKDQPIAGRVVNTEGKPVAGATVSAASVHVPADGDLDGYLAGWKKSWRDIVSSPRKRAYIPLETLVGATTTDADGRFTIRGAGAERVVHVAVAGAGLAKDTVYVITRAGFDPKPYNAAANDYYPPEMRMPRQTPVLYGPEMHFVAEPGVTLEGTIKDAATGAVLAGVGVNVHTSFGDGVMARSGPDGSFRLSGVPKTKGGYRAHVGTEKSGYLSRSVQIPDGDGFGPFRADVLLQKGAVVTGRVIDRQTGKGVLAGVRFAPLPDNRFFDSKPGFDNYKTDRTMGSSDADGRFRLVTIPGRAVVSAQVHGGLRFHGEHLNPYRRAEPEEKDRAAFRYLKDEDTWTVATAGGSSEYLSTENAVKIVEVQEAGETTVDLYVERGTTATLAVQDADGQPLAGAWVAGLTEHWPITYKLPEPTATVYALHAAKPRTLFIYHPDKKLGGTVTIRGDETEPVAAKLGPLASIAGRFLDADGTPLAGLAVSVNGRTTAASELYRFAKPPGPVTTDRDGRFTLPGIVAGLPFHLQIQKGKDYLGGKPKLGPRTLTPGEAHDLGDRTLEPLR